MDLKVINKQAGFTLVEVLVVMLILVALASVTLDFTKDFAFQGRYEVTKDRYEKIKRAIIGRPDVLINGQPDISGFVADMGRLPLNIRELIDPAGYCQNGSDWSNKADCEDAGKGNSTWLTLCSNSSYTNQSDCETNNAIWKGWKTYGFCTDNTIDDEKTCEDSSETWTPVLWGGWQGPYLSISKDISSDTAYLDGWGNTNNLINYGWVYALVDTDTGLNIQSLGQNQAAAGSGYDEDFPVKQPVINQDDWTLDISKGVTASFQKYMGSCSYTREPCLNSGGIWKEACTFQNTDNNNLCGNDTVANPDIADTLWIESLDYCKFNQSSCESPNAHTSESGSWRSCHFFEASCPGSWNELFTTSTNCGDAGGVWNSGTSHCEYSSLTNCEAAGGSWDSNTKYCNTCNIKNNSNQCTDAGGTFHATKTWSTIAADLASCNAAGGNWNSAAATDEEKCSGASLCQFKPAECDLVNGSWQPSCTFNEPHCTNANIDGTWDIGSSHCSLDGYISKDKCIEQQGNWLQEAEYIFMAVNYREKTGLLGTATSEPEKIYEEGSYQTISFIFDGDQSTSIIDTFSVPMGETRVGVYKAHMTSDNQSDCNTNNFSWNVGLSKCFNKTDDFYPASCSGLTETDCLNADGGDIDNPAKLLANGMCDNVTANECSGANGFLVRNTVNIPIVPHKLLPNFNW